MFSFFPIVNAQILPFEIVIDYMNTSYAQRSKYIWSDWLNINNTPVFSLLPSNYSTKTHLQCIRGEMFADTPS